jgi:hypothetical protein
MFRECTHIKTNGIKCHSPAMRGTSLCFYHARSRHRTPSSKVSNDLSFDLPDLTEPGMTLIAINEVIHALAAKQISGRRAGALLYGIQMAERKLVDFPVQLLLHRPPALIPVASQVDITAPDPRPKGRKPHPEKHDPASNPLQ